MKNLTVLICCIAALVSCSGGGLLQPSDYVNPLIATCGSLSDQDLDMIEVPFHSTANCFPGAQVPFGMVSPGPNNSNSFVANTGYNGHYDTLYGFSFMHMSGSSWAGEFGNFLTMASTGEFHNYHGDESGKVAGWESRIDKKTEKASAGYYSAFLQRYGIMAECTATERVGVLRFTFPESAQSRIQTDLSYRITGASAFQEVEVLSDSTLTGHLKYTDREGGWGNGDAHINYDLYFYAVLSKPMKSCYITAASLPDGYKRDYEGVRSEQYASIKAAAEPMYIDMINPATFPFTSSGECLGIGWDFQTHEGETVTLKVAFSFAGRDAARRNYEAEAAGKDFDTIHQEAKSKWNKELRKISVEGGSDTEKTIFYTAFYHSCIDPRLFCDADGSFKAADGKISKSDTYSRRTVFSGWDVFRSHMPLHTYINPSMVSDLLSSLTDLSQESGRGYFERWELLNSYTGCMLGNPALPVLADAYLKGVRDFDVDKAYEVACRTSAMSAETHSSWIKYHCAMSYLFEVAYADWCLGRLADALGKSEDAALYYNKSLAYKDLYNPEIGWFIPKDEDGSWRTLPERGLKTVFYGTCESNPLQQGWFAPQDPEGLAELIGGRERALEKLDSLFENTSFTAGYTDYYNHGNEPVHFVPFLYNIYGRPSGAQKWCRKTLSTLFTAGIEGVPGNEDEGQMSAWYVWVASGLHPFCPASDRIEILSPLFNKVKFSLDEAVYGGRTFELVAHCNSSENIYVQKAKLNGQPLDRCYITVDEFTSGGRLELWMGPNPSDWGACMAESL